MDTKMFYSQNEQTAGCSGCTGNAGACGKTADVAELQDKLTGALIGMARAAKGKRTENSDQLILEGLFTAVTNVNFYDKTVRELTDRIHGETARLGSAVQDYNMKHLWDAQEDIRSLKTLLLFGIRGMAAYACHAAVLGYRSEEVQSFFYRVLIALGNDSLDRNDLLPLVMETGRVNLICMELLDRARTETSGTTGK